MPLSTNIRTRREELFIRCSELAYAANVDISWIHDFESGIKMPNIQILVSIANALDVSIDWLLDRKGFIVDIFKSADRNAYDLIRDELQPLSVNIRLRREELCITLNQLAKEVTLDITDMEAVERGIGIPSIRGLVAIADALNISVDKLLSRDKNKAIKKKINEKIKEQQERIERKCKCNKYHYYS